MALTSISNGDSGSSARSKINAIITAVNTSRSPRVLHVTTAGNDTTGDGSPGAPYRTAQKAWDVAIAGTGLYVIQLGVVQETIIPTAAWPTRITVAGSWASYLSVQSNTYPVNIASDGMVQIELSVTGAELHATRCRGLNAFTFGSPGAAGTPGTPGDSENPGGDGGAGENGNPGPVLTLIDCSYDNAASLGGSGGAGGAGGSDGGMGAGSAGEAGSSGAAGTAYIFGSNIGAMTCDQLHYAQTNIADMSSIGSTTGTDFGANSTMTIPAP